MKIKSLVIGAVALLLMSGCTSSDNESVYNPLTSPSITSEIVVTDSVTGTAQEIAVPTPTILPTDESQSDITSLTLELHFIDVGQADATLIVYGADAMLIDGGNAEDSSLIYTYLKAHNIKHLNYIVCTHAHEDHVGGLAGALNYATVDTVFCPTKSYDTRAFNSFIKYLDKQNIEITVPSVGTEFELGKVQCSVLAVNSSNEDDPNNTSIILRLVYGNTSFLFSGDAEYWVESAVIEDGFDIACTVMKVPHHGSETSMSYRWLREAAPQYAVISVGKDNSYGHPTEAALSRLRDADVKVFRTDLQGHIVCVSNGEAVKFSVERNPDVDTLVKYNQETTTTQHHPANVSQNMYVLNTNTMKIHYPTCASVNTIQGTNKQETSLSKDELYTQGYTSCGRCNP